ncbi:MAG: hypothetical protein M0Z42_01215 [Actinomycetota bacterium]|nr:hypothetical protein [Actinomycetota bacterium]
MIASGAQRVALVATRFLDHDRRLPGDEVDQLVAVRVSLTAMGRGVLEVGRSQQVAVDWGGSPDGRGAKRTPPSLATSTTTASEGTTETSPGCTGTCAPSSALLTSGTLDTTAIRVRGSDASCRPRGQQTVGGIIAVVRQSASTWRAGSADRRRSPRNRR